MATEEDGGDELYRDWKGDQASPPPGVGGHDGEETAVAWLDPALLHIMARVLRWSWPRWSRAP
jgi:hypothetical protein